MQRSVNTASAALGALVFALLITAQPSAAQRPIQRDQNAKVCQVITPVGSRLATKKFCATRAEWEDKRRQDREAIEKVQMMQCMVEPGRC